MKEKVLVIIPAYNEEDNIEKVIKDVKENISYADILIINDCSTDNTLEIIKRYNIKYINNIFNLKYALSIQTGIKYAYYNNYDYVIQMDADGQHRASDGDKLFKEIKKTNADIIIGSRYLIRNDYPCPLFRRIGTKLFQIMIKIFTSKKITDSLSGFQCLNKKVIECYALYENYPEYPDANLIIEMLLKGYKIKEIPVNMKLRENGISMHSGIFKPIKYMIKQFFCCIIIFIKTVGKRKEEDK